MNLMRSHWHAKVVINEFKSCKIVGGAGWLVSVVLAGVVGWLV